jgi:hypothetical protein
MVVSSVDITQKTYKKLVLQVSLNELSFCVIDLITHKVIHTQEILFEKNKVIEEQLWRAFVDFSILTNSYDEVVVLHNNNLNAFVPTSLFDASFLASYLQYNTKVFETDFFAFDAIAPFEINNVYVPFMNINNFLLDQFDSFDYKNSNSVLVKKIIEISKNVEEKQVFVHIQKEHFEMIVVKNQELLLYNSFQYATPEDFIYYLLFTCEQLQLNPETINIQLLGNCIESDELFKITYKYIRNCSLYKAAHLSEGFDVSEAEIRKNFILYHS